jgi:peptide-methionine (S)-S-oxide reductase
MLHVTLMALAALSFAVPASVASVAPSPGLAPAPAVAPLDTVVVAGGCFWGVQGVFQHVKGVVSATSGYSGGSVARPTYEQVSTGTTGHAESVRVVFDPAVVSYRTLMEVFFRVAHDPTERDRQGPDVGTQYRSAIFYTSEAQREATLAYVALLERTNAVKGKVVTQVAPLRGFTAAEAYHQDYLTLHPTAPYIVYNDAPKLAQLKRDFPQLWSDRIASH